MKTSSILIFILAFSLSCSENGNNFPIEPYIEFRNVAYQEGEYPDSIIFDIYIRDGDFDIGAQGSYRDNYYTYFFKSNGSKYSKPIKPSDLSQLITYKDKRLKIIDTLPEFKKPFNCTNWRTVFNENGIRIDTVYFQENLNYYNLFVDYYTLENNGQWQKFKFEEYYSYPNCYTNNYQVIASIQTIASSSSLDNYYQRYTPISSSEAILRQYLVSPGYKFIFAGKKVKLKIRIQDRAFHKSNEIVTSTLQF